MFKIISHILDIIILHKTINLIKTMNGTLVIYFLNLTRGNLFTTWDLQGLVTIFRFKCYFGAFLLIARKAYQLLAISIYHCGSQ